MFNQSVCGLSYPLELRAPIDATMCDHIHNMKQNQEGLITVISEILVPHVCGGSKIAQIQKFQKMQNITK